MRQLCDSLTLTSTVDKDKDSQFMACAGRNASKQKLGQNLYFFPASSNQKSFDSIGQWTQNSHILTRKFALLPMPRQFQGRGSHALPPSSLKRRSRPVRRKWGHLRYIAETKPKTWSLRYIAETKPKTWSLRYIAETKPKTWSLRYIAETKPKLDRLIFHQNDIVFVQNTCVSFATAWLWLRL